MYQKKLPFKCVSGILVFSLMLSLSCMTSSAVSPNGYSNKSTATAIAANTALYHSYFDLEADQKADLSSHGYSAKQISNLDDEDYTKIRGTWKLTDDEVKDSYYIYPQLKGTDISSWTYSDFMAYSKKQDDLHYAPTAEQARQLTKRGISLALAREMLSDYCTYDNMLAQSDDTLAAMMKVYNEADAQGKEFIKQKSDIRDEYFQTVLRK